MSNPSESQHVPQGISALRRRRGSIIGQITAFTNLLDAQQNSGTRDLPFIRTQNIIMFQLSSGTADPSALSIWWMPGMPQTTSYLVTQPEYITNYRSGFNLIATSSYLLGLIPHHFLTGESLMSLRKQDFRNVPPNHLSSWQHVQKLKQHLWTRWHRKYLNEFATRNKWNKGDRHQIKDGTLVLLKGDNLLPRKWALGRVRKVHPGSDGIVRAD